MQAPLVVFVALGIGVFSGAAYAQSKEEKPAAAPKHACTVPPDVPGKLATDNQHKRFKKELDAYRDCLTNFSNAQRAEAQARIEAANAAVEEYNKFVESVRKARSE